MPAELETLREEVRALTERVAALEGASESRPSRPTTVNDSDAFWALNELVARLPEDPSTAAGAVLLTGSLTLSTGEPVSWQQAAGTAGLLDSEWEDRAATFAALGHPVRLELLRQILAGIRTTAQLAELETLGTTGQLHHHLRQLLAAGWLRQSGRGSYEVPATRVVPLLACLTGAER